MTTKKTDNSTYLQNFYKNYLELLDKHKGKTPLKIWCKSCDLNPTIFYSVNRQLKKGLSLNFQTMITIANSLDVDLIEMLKGVDPPSEDP